MRRAAMSKLTGKREIIMKSMSTRIVIATAAFLGISLAGPMSARGDAPQHHDQVPGFYRLKVGDLEVTSLYDGDGKFDPHWLNGKERIMTAVSNTAQKEPHFLDASEVVFLVNTGKQLILVDSGSGQWFGGGAFGRLETSLRSAGYTPEQVDLVLITHLHSDHIGGLTTRDGKRVFSNAESMLRRLRMTSGCQRKSPPRHRGKRKSSFRPPRRSPRHTSRRENGTYSAARMESGKESRLFPFPGIRQDIPVMNSARRARGSCSGVTSFMPRASS